MAFICRVCLPASALVQEEDDMFFNRTKLITGVLCIAVIFQFIPIKPIENVNAAGYCNWVSIAADLSVPDGSNFQPGESFSKAWRLKNIGSCTWTTSYLLIFSKGDLMGAPSAVFSLYKSVAPGAQPLKNRPAD
jgi:hypothetical protein